MPYDEKLAARIREALVSYRRLEEKKMFSGMCFMVNGKMCICINDKGIMCRIDPEQQDEVMEKSGTREMIHNKRVYRGFVYVDKEVLQSKKEFDYWVNLFLEFNKKAKSSKKKAPAKKKAPIKKKSKK